MKTQTQHTPGPWRTGDAGHTIFGPKTDKPSPVTIARIPVRNEANARLIAAAPEMLSACQRAPEDFQSGKANASTYDALLRVIHRNQQGNQGGSMKLQLGATVTIHRPPWRDASGRRYKPGRYHKLRGVITEIDKELIMVALDGGRKYPFYADELKGGAS